MSRIEIDWLSDYSDCEQCGGNYADGAIVRIDGKAALKLIPRAHCFGGDHYDERHVYRRILEHLGHEVFDPHAPIEETPA